MSRLHWRSMVLIRAFPLAIAWFSLCGSTLLAADAKVVEKYDSGKVKAEYTTNSDGKKKGSYVEYYESGVVKIKATYRDDQLNGKYVSYYPTKRIAVRSIYRFGKLNGAFVEYSKEGKMNRKAVYVDGVLHGLDQKMDGRKILSKQLWKNGELIQVWRNGEIVLEGTTPSEIKQGLAEIAKTKVKGPGTDLMKRAVRKLMCYRFLCGVPHEGMELVEQMNLEAEGAAKICSGLGRLTHKPQQNPGLSQEVFEAGKKGAARSNLHGGGNVSTSIDSYMEDSDPSNIGRVGHRRWCLNPYMQKLGLGAAGNYSALWAHDKSRTVEDWKMVAYPPRGYMPVQYFHRRHAWSVSFNKQHWVLPGKESLKVTIRTVKVGSLKGRSRRQPKPTMNPLTLDYLTVSKTSYGSAPCVIFRPQHIDVRPGWRYHVSIEGITTSEGEPTTISYFVEFM